MPVRAALVTRRVAALVGPVALAAAVSGCGARTTRIDGHELRLRLEEYRFVPGNVSVPAGRLKIVAYNAGLVTHNVVVELARRDSNGNAVIEAAIPTILPGHTGPPMKLDLAPGRYLLVSTIANQADLGMTGTLVVR